MRVSFASATDTGMRRSINEDSLSARDDLGLFVVADGMGGHAAGEVASRVAVDEIQRFIETSTAFGPPDTWPVPFDQALGRDGNRLRAGFELANRRIAQRVEVDHKLSGMGTTAVALLLNSGKAALAHVGDSRAYLFHDKQVSRLTRDHSWVEEQIVAGTLTPDAAHEHPWRNIVTRSLSGNNGLEVEVTELELKTGDRLLLCSDGLSSVLTDDEIGEIVTAGSDLRELCRELIRHVNAGGGPDNVTALIIEFDAK